MRRATLVSAITQRRSDHNKVDNGQSGMMYPQDATTRYSITRQDNAAIYWPFFTFAMPRVILRDSARSLPSRMVIRAGKMIQRLGTEISASRS